jgi:hypothetical protein
MINQVFVVSDAGETGLAETRVMMGMEHLV